MGGKDLDAAPDESVDLKSYDWRLLSVVTDKTLYFKHGPRRPNATKLTLACFPLN